MAFSFGNTSQPGFGANTNKPTAFGAPFGVTTTTASSGFGGFGGFGATSQPAAGGFGAPSQPTGGGFGTPAQQTAGGFGAPAQQTAGGFGTPAQQTAGGFGAPAQPTAGGFGSTFGTQTGPAPGFGSTFGSPANAAPAFGTSFGTPASTASTFGTGFGPSAGGTSLFGTPTTKPSLFGTPATSSSLFSTPATAPNLFGAATTTQASSLFGTATSTTPSLFGTGTASTGGLFGAGAATSAAPNLFASSFGGATSTAGSTLFGGGSTGGTGFGLFGGTTTTSAPSLFGGFGGAQTTGGFGGFGGTAPAAATGFGAQQPVFGGGFGARPAATAAVPQTGLTTQQQQDQLVTMSIYSISIYNDERDEIMKKWNLLQASWGTGKGYFNLNQPPVEYNVNNMYYRFKAVAYNVIPGIDNSEGVVKLIFNRKYAELNPQRAVLVSGLSGILGNKPNLKVTILHVKPVNDNQSEIHIMVIEKSSSGSTRKVLATDLANFLNQPTQKQPLTNVGVTTIAAYVAPSRSTLEEYLRTIPDGFEPHMWRAAIMENPNPRRYIPVPIYGFNDLKARKTKQDYQTGIQRAALTRMEDELQQLKEKQACSVAKINDLKQRFLHLQHQTLKILVRLESIRRSGLPMQAEEEYLKGKLAHMYTALSNPTQFSGKLNELLATVKLMEFTPAPPQIRYRLVPESRQDLKDFLQLQQNGIGKLVEIVKDDMRALNIVTDGIHHLARHNAA